MKAEDTVMKDKQLMKFELQYSRDDTFYWGAAFDAALKAQAEITWDIAFKAGQQEVVEWVNYYLGLPELQGTSCLKIIKPQLDVKLKDWGL